MMGPMVKSNTNKGHKMKITPSNFSTLSIGHILSVPGRKTPVRVTKIVERDSRLYALTTSGRVRPGRVSGGCVTLWKDSGLITWQPTINQAASRADVEVIGLAS